MQTQNIYPASTFRPKFFCHIIDYMLKPYTPVFSYGERISSESLSLLVISYENHTY